MTFLTFFATVRVCTSDGLSVLINTKVQATDAYRAKLMLDAQYGVGNVIGYPYEI